MSPMEAMVRKSRPSSVDANRTETVASRTSGRLGSCPVAPAAGDCTEVLNALDRGEKDHAIVQSTRRRQRP
jgi:hypothetical protein